MHSGNSGMKCNICGFTWANIAIDNCPMCGLVHSVASIVDSADTAKKLAQAFTQDNADPDDLPMSDDDFSNNENELLSL